ncbi:unnamed protein product [Effrenium voratum]|uniref:Lon protease homolog n=1 Tax=Effrenium voratum TaxID=2562239 RepID=A0AA36NJ93_9DINO|nr:unnamed protein product [Effrenium voratum]
MLRLQLASTRFLRPRLWSRDLREARAFAGRSSRGPREEKVTKEPAVETPQPAASATGASATGASAPEVPRPVPQGLLVLPLLRKPAFPGFRQTLQVSEPEIINFLQKEKKQGDYIGGFLIKEPFADGDASGLRREAGRVSSASQLEEVGTVLQVLVVQSFGSNQAASGGQITVMPMHRVRRTGTLSQPSPYVPVPAVVVADLEPIQGFEDAEEATTALAPLVTLLQSLNNASPLLKQKYEKVGQYFRNCMQDPVKVTDLAAGLSTAERGELQAVLQEQDIREKIKKVTHLLERDLNTAKLQSEVKSDLEERVAKEQKREVLMEQMRQIQKELGIEKDEKQTLTTQFRDSLKDKVVPEEVQKVIETEISKLNSLEPSSTEFNVCRTYLEWLTCLPWGKFTGENRDINKAESMLEEDHYGLEDVKERILEHIAVSFLKDSSQGKIMCLVGPPGVGKTSVGKSVARALGRKFYRFSVGGMNDVVEIKGHRRTYVGAMPGKLIQCLKSTGCGNPVVLIDEIDKLGRDMRGDPSSALLEVLDPEQNSSFRDHYLDVPIDLSNILFLCTANVLDTIPGPLLDRMEVIRIAGYVFEEKLAIASKYLIPQTEEGSGIGADRLDLGDEVLQKIIKDYAREAGVRNLRQLLEKVSRKVALDLVRKKCAEEGPAKINLENLTTYIGQPLHTSDKLYNTGTPPGVVMGLAWTASGGATLYVEARGRMPCGRVQGGLAALTPVEVEPQVEKPKQNGSMQVTGQLGSVMSESSSISLTYARLFMRELDPENSFLDAANIHLHVPEGATPKDGPSAGVTMTSALLSSALEQPLREDLAMTGELTLMGKVLKVGGIKEKVIAARREGVKTLILPRQNEADFLELKEYLRAGLTAHFVDHYDDVYRLAFDAQQVPALASPSRGLPVVTVEPPPDPQPAPEEGDAGSNALPWTGGLREQPSMPSL